VRKLDLQLKAKIIGRFITATNRDHYLALIQNPKTRHKSTLELAHFGDLRMELFEAMRGDFGLLFEFVVSKLALGAGFELLLPEACVR
jgi:hypothetical protein